MTKLIVDVNLKGFRSMGFLKPRDQRVRVEGRLGKPRAVRARDFEESKHPRVKSGSEAGEFTSKSGGSSSSEAAAPNTEAKSASKAPEKPTYGVQPDQSKAQAAMEKFGLNPNDKISIKNKKGLEFSSLKTAHGKTVAEYVGDHPALVKGYAEELAYRAQTGHIKLGGGDLGKEAEEEVQKKNDLRGNVDFDRSSVENKADYDKEVAKHYQPNKAEIKALQNYTGSSTDLNEALRNNEDLSGPWARHVKHLASFLDKSKLIGDKTLYRGVDELTWEAMDHLKEGDIVSDRGFMSTSLSRGLAESFGHEGKEGGKLMVIRAKAGSKAGFVGNHSHADEKEVVLPDSAQLKYAGRSKEGHAIFDYHGE